ncbi:MAG: VOC family protein [Sphingobium sp.]
MIAGIDHVAITVADVDRSCAFYDKIFGAKGRTERVVEGVVLVRQIAIGGALFSVHRLDNGLRPVAAHPTPGSADICLRWQGAIDPVVDLLRLAGVAIVEGPVDRIDAHGLPGLSVYFRDPDDNLIEIMADA